MSLSCDLELRALNMSKKTKQVKVMVRSWLLIWPSSIVTLYTHSTPAMITEADKRTLAKSALKR